MKNYNVLLLIVCLVGILGIIFFFPNLNPKKILLKNKAPIQLQNQGLLPQTSTEGVVSVKVKPNTLQSGSPAEFELTLDTHSVELNYDIAAITILQDDSKRIYKPVSWTGGKGGHHVEGILTFPAITQSAKSVTLTIPQIDNQDRVFTWKL